MKCNRNIIDAKGKTFEQYFQEYTKERTEAQKPSIRVKPPGAATPQKPVTKSTLLPNISRKDQYKNAKAGGSSILPDTNKDLSSRLGAAAAGGGGGGNGIAPIIASGQASLGLNSLQNSPARFPSGG